MATEAAALGTAFLYADFLADPHRIELKKTLLDYSETRILPEASSLRSDQDVSLYLSRTLKIQGLLWPITQSAFEAPSPIPAPIKSLVAKSITDVLDAHTFRMVSLPAPVSFFGNWMMIIAAGVALFLLGHRAALLGRELSWRTFVYCVFLVAIILVILDTQRATEGYIRQDQGVLHAAIAQMKQAYAADTSVAE